MTIKLNVKSDLSRLLIKFPEMQKQVRKAVKFALNRSMSSTRTESARIISRELGLKVGDVKNRLTLVKATDVRLTSEIHGTGKRIPLIHFKARQAKEGVVVNLGGKRVLYRGHFIATMPTGHRGVFFRKGGRRVYRRDDKGHVYSSELPIVERTGPGIPQTITRNAVFKAIEKKMYAEWDKNIAHEIERLLK